MYDVVVNSSRSLSHLLMSSCISTDHLTSCVERPDCCVDVCPDEKINDLWPEYLTCLSTFTLPRSRSMVTYRSKFNITGLQVPVCMKSTDWKVKTNLIRCLLETALHCSIQVPNVRSVYFKDPWLKVMVARLNTAENTKPVKKKGQGMVQ